MPMPMPMRVLVPVPHCVPPDGASYRSMHGVETGDDGALGEVGCRTRRTHAAATYNPEL